MLFQQTLLKAELPLQGHSRFSKQGLANKQWENVILKGKLFYAFWQSHTLNRDLALFCEEYDFSFYLIFSSYDIQNDKLWKLVKWLCSRTLLWNTKNMIKYTLCRHY